MNKKLLITLMLMFLITGCKTSPQSTDSSINEDESVEVVMYTSVPYSTEDVQLFSSEEHVEKFKQQPNIEALLQTYAKSYLVFEDQNEFSSFSYRSVTIDNTGLVHIDMTLESYNAITIGDFMETSVLDGIAKTILLNIPEATGVTYTVEQGSYQSNQYQIGLNTPYKVKSDYQQ